MRLRDTWFKIAPSLAALNLLVGLALCPVAGLAQGNGSGSTLQQLSVMFSQGNPVQQIQMSGTADWFAGDVQDSGTVTLTASSNGGTQVQFSLGTSGSRTESQSMANGYMSCQWAGSDGIAHPILSGACWRPVFWFLPAMSLQPSLLLANSSVVDRGIGTVGASEGTYRIIQAQVWPSDALPEDTAQIAATSATIVGLDPSSLLPMVVAYSVPTDSGAMSLIAIEIHYSDYHVVDGVQIPFTIQRYVNGSLQIQISLSSTQIN